MAFPFKALACMALLMPVLAPLEACRAKAPAVAATGGETIILVRHGEKPPTGLGQLTCMGLNRSLALPNVLIGRYGRADAIYAPNPADQIHDNRPGLPPSPLYSYVRPLATIEPTAIQLGLPVNTQIAYSNIRGLEQAVTAPEYAHSTVYIAWEHYYAEQFGKLMLRSYGLDPSAAPHWSNDDYETIYVFKIAPAAAGAARGQLSFLVQKEGLESSLTNVCPDQKKP